MTMQCMELDVWSRLQFSTPGVDATRLERDAVMDALTGKRNQGRRSPWRRHIVDIVNCHPFTFCLFFEAFCYFGALGDI